ncbi:MAG: hypothetical protein V1792_09815 [Pseudomonadota bacterium]
MLRSMDELIGSVKDDISDTSRYYSDYRPHQPDSLVERFGEGRKSTLGVVSQRHQLQTLLKTFRPIPASPKRGGIYKKVYVYPSSESFTPKLEIDENFFYGPTDQAASRPAILNHPELPVERLAKNLAQGASETLFNESERDKVCYLISGKRGVGKTAFLNYLFSTQHHHFNDLKVIWVRADVTAHGFGTDCEDHARSRLPFSGTLINLLQWQTYNILCTRYLDGGTRVIRKKDYYDLKDYEEALKAHRERSDDLSCEKLREYLLLVADEYVEIGTRPRIEDASFLKELAQLTKHELLGGILNLEISLSRVNYYRDFCQRQGYSFIYILDGLDEASVPMQEAGLLRVWKSELIAIMLGKMDKDIDIPGVYIVCARDESFKEFVTHAESSSIASRVKQGRLEPVPFNEIVEKRLAYFEERSGKKGTRYWSGEWIEGSARSLIDLSRIGINKAFEEEGIHEGILEALSKSGHLRAVLKFFRDAIWETSAILEEEYGDNIFFPHLSALIAKMKGKGTTLGYGDLKKTVEKKHYRIWSLSSLNYANSFKRSIRFDLDKQKLIYPSPAGELPLIPVIWGDIEFNRRGEYFRSLLLAKIRILQILEHLPEKRFPFGSLSDTMAAIFTHDPSEIDVILQAMILERLVDYVWDRPILEPMSTSELEITDLGKEIVRKWIYLPSYIEYTMNLAALPSSIVKDFKFFFIQRSKGPLSGGSEELYLRTPEYVASVFRSWAKFAAAISAVERWERRRFAVWKHENPDHPLRDFDPMWIETTIKEKLKFKAAKILERAAEDAQVKIREAVAEEYGFSRSAK